MQHKEKVKDIFSFSHDAQTWSRMYENANSVFEDTMRMRRDLVVEYISERFEKNVKILDVGCGTGVLMEKLLDRGMNVVGVDLSRDMLMLAGKRIGKYVESNSLLMQSDCEFLPFEDSEFDLIVCLGVISFLKDEGNVLAEFKRILKKDGMLILSVRNKFTLSLFADQISLGKIIYAKLSLYIKKRLFSKKRNGEKKNVYVDEVSIPRLFNLFQLKKRFNESGFRVTEVKRIGYGPFKLNGKNLFPESFSIRLSRYLNRIFSVKGAEILKWGADVCIFIAEKRENFKRDVQKVS